MKNNYEKEKAKMKILMIIGIFIFLFGLIYFIGKVAFNLSFDKIILFYIITTQILFLIYFIWDITKGGYYNG